MKITLLNADRLENAPPLRLRGEIMVNRIYSFNCQDSPSYILPQDKDHFFDVIWDPFPGAAEYDFEWSFYHRDSEVWQFIQNEEGPIFENFDFLFRNNTTRVSIDATGSSYRINAIYPNGYIVYRARAAFFEVVTIDGIETTIRKYSQWTSDRYTNRTMRCWDYTSKINSFILKISIIF